VDKINEIHTFWFHGISDATPINKDEMPFKKWFVKDRRTDEEIKNHFESTLLKAAEGGCGDWEKTEAGTLSLILMFDQFSRNIYRNSPRMFAFDPQALALCQDMIEEGKDRKMMLIERVFLYLPLEHSEEISYQEVSLRKFASLAEESKHVNPANTAYYEYTFNYAQRHYDIIKRFGRFPHRNRVLGRVSTKEEEDFLKQPGSGF
jgi:uncharacterized protein (DUF924 family)